MQPGQEIRLNKFLAERLGISRREADNYIAAGKILIEKSSEKKRPAILGERIDNTTKIYYNNKLIPIKLQFTYLAMNKPVGYVCSKKRQGDSPTIYELLPKKYQHLKTVGRLDKDSSGLILLTNDGDFAFSMTHPKFYKEKRYLVELDRDLEPLHQQLISDFGIDLPDGKSKLGLVNRSDLSNDSQDKSNHPTTRTHWEVIMSEGRNRQIRRTFAAVGYRVKKLHRIQFGKYILNDLRPGKFLEISKL
ncbi:rRNA pseudouridine synthase [Candidatus Saccharibacteria bacterium]|nr:rRNA pseudouridine synthase [Candidatus Saccharibacteria bacterium]